MLPFSTESDATKPRHTAFFYGTLMLPSILHRVTDGTSSPTPTQRARFTHTAAILHQHCRHKVRLADYPGVIHTAGKSVRGVYVQGLSDRDMWLLDRFEGSQYQKQEVSVQLLKGESLFGEDEKKSGGNAKGRPVESGNLKGNSAGNTGDVESNEENKAEIVQTQTYIFIDSDLEDEEWDFEHFKREKLHRWVGNANEEYIDVDGEFNDPGAEEDGTVTGAVINQPSDPTSHSVNGGSKRVESEALEVRCRP